MISDLSYETNGGGSPSHVSAPYDVQFAYIEPCEITTSTTAQEVREGGCPWLTTNTEGRGKAVVFLPMMEETLLNYVTTTKSSYGIISTSYSQVGWLFHVWAVCGLSG